jgi:hypothetical protein
MTVQIWLDGAQPVEQRVLDREPALLGDACHDDPSTASRRW